MDNLTPVSSDLRILAIDIGGSGVKASVLDPDGSPLSERLRVKTPIPCTPAALLDTIGTLVAPLAALNYNRVSVGFPGVVRRGIVYTAANLGTEALRNFALADELAKLLGHPVRVINDADMQGLAVVKGQGVELVITLGTGMGSAIFSDGQLGPHLEISHHPLHKGKTYEDLVGNAAREKAGKEKWNRRVRKVIKALRALTNFDRLYIGGGNAKDLTFTLDPDVEIVDNSNGIRGGRVALAAGREAGMTCVGITMRAWLFAVLLSGGMATSGALAQQPDVDKSAASKESHGFGISIGNLKVGYDDGGAVFLFGAFCALWAQNTRRNPWLWFFMGLLFSVIAVIVLLVKNSDDNFEMRQYGRTSQGQTLK